MIRPSYLAIFLAVATTSLVLTCGPIPPPAPEVDFATAQPEITILPPHTAQTVDTVGDQITIRVKLRYSSALDSVNIVVKGTTSTGADTTEKSQRLTEVDFIGDSTTVSYLPFTPGAKTVSVTVWFPNGTRNTADYILSVTFAPSISITPPHNAQIVDTVGDAVTFGINHTYADFLDSLVVQVKDSSASGLTVERIYRFTVFTDNLTNVRDSVTVHSHRQGRT